ncbi:MAG: hypothetical protein JSV87_06030 [Candidatus Bathyarchaeota archaeon]|nr:MAG: hypothetical protein JSV87_06030 [Candidatus Bathyarchaeota archaeon]
MAIERFEKLRFSGNFTDCGTSYLMQYARRLDIFDFEMLNDIKTSANQA